MKIAYHDVFWKTGVPLTLVGDVHCVESDSLSRANCTKSFPTTLIRTFYTGGFNIKSLKKKKKKKSVIEFVYDLFTCS